MQRKFLQKKMGFLYQKWGGNPNTQTGNLSIKESILRNRYFFAHNREVDVVFFDSDCRLVLDKIFLMK